jgi:hypothetical protein
MKEAPYFDMDMLIKAIKSIKLWQRILFFFLPTYISVDFGNKKDKHTTLLYFKKFRGVVYLIKEKVKE